MSQNASQNETHFSTLYAQQLYLLYISHRPLASAPAVAVALGKEKAGPHYRYGSVGLKQYVSI